MTNPLQLLLQQEETVLLDGATGTVLMGMGLDEGAPPELWNREHPDRIRQMHQAYVDAGSRLILTNSFGGSRFRLKLHKLDDSVYELNRLAAELARQVADAAPHLVAVGGSIGPSGELFEPMGQMRFTDAVEAFAEQARGLADGGADAFCIETMSDVQEVEAAVTGVRQVSDLPICATMTFDTKGHTMMGVSPEAALAALREWDLLALGANCGNGPDEIEAVIRTMKEMAPNIPLIAKSNAGIPQWIDNALSYSGTPEVMGMYAQRARALGARLIGGCCGNGPEHVRAMHLALAQPVLDAAAVAAPVAVPDDVAGGDSGSASRRRSRRRRREA